MKMKKPSIQFVLLAAGLVVFMLAASSDAASFSYEQYYDDDYTSDDGADDVPGHDRSPSPYDEEDYYTEEEVLDEGRRDEPRVHEEEEEEVEGDGEVTEEVLVRRRGGGGRRRGKKVIGRGEGMGAEERLSSSPAREEEEYEEGEEDVRATGERREEVGEEEEEEYEGRVTPAYYDEGGVDGVIPPHAYDEVTPSKLPTHDPLAAARTMAVLHVMDKLLQRLGENFGKKLPKAPTNNALATVPTPINITAEPCPYKYKRCSSQTSFPSCDIPRNADPEVWSQRFNLYFSLPASDLNNMDIINATLRLYKNKSIPLHVPKPLVVKANVYTRSLTIRSSKPMLTAETTVSSDYIGWVTLPMDKIVKRWRKPRTNRGLLITVTDADTIPWEGSSIFVTMSCSSGNNNLIPLPFEVQIDDEGQRYPALNIRQGITNDEYIAGSMIRDVPTQRPALPTETFSGLIQSDDPYVYEDEYISQPTTQRHPFSGHYPSTTQNIFSHGTRDHPVHPHTSHPHRAVVHNIFPYGHDSTHEDSTHRSGHRQIGSHDHSVRGSSHDAGYPYEAPRHEISSDYLVTNEATARHHVSNPRHRGGIAHHRNPDHFIQGPVDHPLDSRIHTTQSTIEDSIHSSQTSDRVSHWESIPTTESSRPHHQRDSMSGKERRHHKKAHHQRHGSSTAVL